MGFFEKLGFKKVINWDDAYYAKVQIYEKDGNIMASLNLSDGMKTVLPRDPKNRYLLDGEITIPNWQLTIFSTTRQKLIAAAGYYDAISILEKYAKAMTETDFLMGYDTPIEQIVNEIEAGNPFFFERL